MKGNFTEDREEWQKELQTQCEEVYTDQVETREVQGNRIEYFADKSDQQFTVEGRTAETTVDLVFQARAKMSDNKVNGPENAVVSELIKQLPSENIHTITKCFQKRFTGHMEVPSSWKIGNWSSWGKETRMRSQRKGSKTFRPLRWHRWCRSGACLILFFVWKKRKNLRFGRICTLVKSTE